MITQRFGTWRGLVRLELSRLEIGFGRGGLAPGNPAEVRRLVFVCQGNVCRSAFADVAARGAGLSTASIGLSTTSGRPAHGPAIDAAAELGIDLGSHRATAHSDFAPQEGDLLLAMETRQLRRIAADERLSALPRSLLGLFTAPVTPHIHDPFGLDDAYMRTCLRRIATAIPVLRARFPGAACDA